MGEKQGVLLYNEKHVCNTCTETRKGILLIRQKRKEEISCRLHAETRFASCAFCVLTRKSQSESELMKSRSVLKLSINVRESFDTSHKFVTGSIRIGNKKKKEKKYA